MSNGATISKDDAKALIDRYQSNHTGTKKAFLYDKDLITDMLNDASECVGMRIYLAQKSNSDLCVVLVGTDSDGNDLTDYTILQHGTSCPSICPANSYFND